MYTFTIQECTLSYYKSTYFYKGRIRSLTSTLIMLIENAIKNHKQFVWQYIYCCFKVVIPGKVHSSSLTSGGRGKDL